MERSSGAELGVERSRPPTISVGVGGHGNWGGLTGVEVGVGLTAEEFDGDLKAVEFDGGFTVVKTRESLKVEERKQAEERKKEKEET